MPTTTTTLRPCRRRVRIACSYCLHAPGAIMLVGAQVVLYVAVYGRLVRGRWSAVRSGRTDLALDPKIEVR